MKKILVLSSAIAALVLVLTLVPGRAEARRRYYSSNVAGEPGNSTFGIGLILGAPTGLSMELKLSGQSALDFAIGLNTFDDTDGGYFHFDYLVYLTDLSRGGSVAVPLYLGIGLAFWDPYRHFNNDDLNVALRVPFGLAIAFRTAPVQFFGELAVRVLFVDQGYDDDTTDLTGGLGFRVYF